MRKRPMLEGSAAEPFAAAEGALADVCWGESVRCVKVRSSLMDILSQNDLIGQNRTFTVTPYAGMSLHRLAKDIGSLYFSRNEVLSNSAGDWRPLP
jgi:hypothetical protein